MSKESTALAKHTPQQLAKASQSLTALAALFGEGNYNLLAPTVHMEIPRGMRLAITEVKVSPNKQDEEVVPISGGKLLVLKHKLDQIAAGAGISWFEERRMDGGQHPHYCEAFVKGRVTDYDGTVRELTGSKTVDLRESVAGVPGKDYDEIVTKAKAGNRDPGRQLMEARKFIAEIAFSKAKNRAIAQALGIKRGYTAAELRKPFVVPKLVLDPTDADAKDLIMANAAGATEALYGSKQRPEPEVIDAPFEEVADESEPPHDPETGEVEQGGESPADVIVAAWARAKAAEISAADFRITCESNSGKTKKEDMTLDEAKAVASAIDARIAGAEPEKDGCPV